MIITKAAGDQILSEHGTRYGQYGLHLEPLTSNRYCVADCVRTHHAYSSISSIIEAGLIRMGDPESADFPE